MDQSPTHQFAYPQSRDIHIIALVPSTLTLLASVLATYWFFSMQRNFRITLVLILVLSDASKSLWIFVFNAVGLAGIPIRTHSAFCQVGGFFLQMSFEACDLAIFLLTTHVTLQILAPRWIPNSRDGLYSVRRWVVVCSVALPMIDALIPFSRFPDATAYTYDGAYCSLFLEPRWYTLSLSWIPRYLTWLFVLGSILSVLLYSKSQTVSRRGSATSQASERSRSIMQGIFGCCWAMKSDELQPLAISRTGTRNQLMKLILYPAIYIMAWSVPFAAQVVSYSTQQDVNSVYPLRAGSVFCVSILGFFDVVIFCWREKPWRYNTRGDGTCTGSLCLPVPVDSRRPSATSDIATPMEPARPHRTHNKGTDSHRRSALHAYERLALERQASRPPMRRFSQNLLTLTDTLDA